MLGPIIWPGLAGRSYKPALDRFCFSRIDPEECESIGSRADTCRRRETIQSKQRGQMSEGGIVLGAGRDHVQGEIEAPITLLEYGDYECRSCAKAQPIVREIQQRLGDKLCYAFRHFPVTPVHPHAQRAAQAAEAANAQGKFWEMHELLLENQYALDDKILSACAAALGLDEARLIGEVMLEIYARRIHRDFNLGVREGVNGTPCFFINGRRYDGAIRFEPLLLAIQRNCGYGKD